MYVAIAMAGEGKRFTKVGFTKPKYELMVKGRPMFDWALESLRAFYQKANFLFIARSGAQEFIATRCAKLGISSFQIIALDAPTDGQATSVKIGIQTLDKTQPLIIYNIDTHISSDAFGSEDIAEEDEGWLLLFRVSGEHWSFAKLDGNGRVLEVTEKKRISDTACLGVYYFKSIALFEEAYRLFADRTKAEYGEVYVAPLYNALIGMGKMIGTKVIDEKEAVVLGTPEEVAKFDPEFLRRYPSIIM